MTNVSTQLFFGVFVTTSSLYIASEAFKKVQVPFLAIQLILLRKSASTLHNSIQVDNSHSNLLNLPSEIWGMIKFELIGLELAESERGLLDSFMCDQCKTMNRLYRQFRKSTKFQNPSLTTWKDFPRNGCNACYDNVFSDIPWVEERLLGDLHCVLSCYNLNIYSMNVDNHAYTDLHPLSAIGIKKAEQECHDFEEYTPFHAITTLSASTFELPFSVEFISRQIKALQRDYGVESGDHTTKTSRSQVPAVLDKVPHDNNDKRTDCDVPSWHLWTRGVNEF